MPDVSDSFVFFLNLLNSIPDANSCSIIQVKRVVKIVTEQKVMYEELI